MPTKKRKKHWYQIHGLKQVSGFVSQTDKIRLQCLAEKEDRNLTQYITRLLEQHIEHHCNGDPTKHRKPPSSIG